MSLSFIKNTPPVVRNIILINIVLFVISSFWTNIIDLGALYYPGSERFIPYQLITHLFLHGGLFHLFTNMFALWMFGRILEGVWGSKRFFIYYFVTGLGAALIHLGYNYFFVVNPMHEAAMAFINTPSPDLFSSFIKDYLPNANPKIYDLSTAFYEYPNDINIINNTIDLVNRVVESNINTPTIGASGAVFGILLAFGMLFPNTELMLMFIPIPIKAKFFVIGYGLMELFLGITNTSSNIAHFAHLGGMIFGFILIKFWNRNSRNFY